jgi:hypothetical protein
MVNGFLLNPKNSTSPPLPLALFCLEHNTGIPPDAAYPVL